MAMIPQFFTLRDDNKTHQVHFLAIGNVAYISCTCRWYTKHNQTSFKPIAQSHDIETARRLYNDPVNHWVPFTEEDRAKW